MEHGWLEGSPRALALLAGLALALTTALGAQRAYRLGPAPEWVRPVALDSIGPPSGQVGEGYERLLVDRQDAVGDGRVERFRHVAYRLLDEGAVQENSQIEIVFDSSFQQLTLHAVNVTRGGRSMDQLRPSRIRVVQRESRLDYQIYDGSLSLILLLEDVRRGDVVEYSYTLRGSNPVFGGHYATSVVLQDGVPVHRLRFRLLWPRDRELFVTPHQTQVQPTVHAAGVYREYMWSDTLIAPKLLDPDRPSWYDAFSEIQLSDFASWSQVAAWGDTLFAASERPPAALLAQLGTIRSAQASPEGRALAALRFVQSEVRYLGVEIGVNSHRPYAPVTVMRRRYGDCKDKVLLLITMLRALGIRAQPALVSTDYGEHVRDFHPTTTVFDHAIVRADIA